MTNEEAIKELQSMCDHLHAHGICDKDSNMLTACKMAISALEQKPYDVQKIYDLKTGLSDWVVLPKLEQKPCEDIAQERYKDLCEYFGGAKDIDELSVTQKPIECDDAISRKPNCIDCIHKSVCFRLDMRVDSDYAEKCGDFLTELPSVTQKSGKCKNCKYFEYDSVAKVDGIPLIVAHEICNKWGNGCKTSEDGYCYLFEPQESEDKE